MLLKNEDKTLLMDILKRNIKAKVEVLVFGSRVNGRAHSGSDLDIVLRLKDKQTINSNEFMNFKDSLKKSNLPFLVDALDWNQIPDSFKDNINQQYEVLQKL